MSVATSGRHRVWPALLLGVTIGLGCASTPPEPLNPAWADVAPILRGECNSCHGWNAGQTGAGYRFDFFDTAACGDAALGLGGVILAGSLAPNGSPLATPKIAQDILEQAGAAWPRMPPQPSPALPDWEVYTLERWASQPPVKGPAPGNNHVPTMTVYDFPAQAAAALSFTAVIDDPDGDSSVGVVETTDLTTNVAFLMNRPGSFDVSFDTSQWPSESVALRAVLCDGWTSTTIPLGTVRIIH